MSKLLYVGQQTADFLSDNIEEHLDRYREAGFEDLESSGDWRIPLSVEVDLTPLEDLIADKGRDAEVRNSMLVGHALASLTPSLARENRVWIRLSHIEGIAYARERWLHNVSQEKIAQAIRIHFFASTWTQCRDDHALSRLWWNHHIASSIQPDDPERALRLILSTADIRSNLIERARVGTRLPLAKAIVRRLERDAQLAASESAFRNFMKALNIRAAGAQLEIWDEERMDRFIAQCVE
ncbi:hypothetical protein L599_004200000070 [Luteimonas sp. J16]|jgi:hypothetical protein|uniref:DUF6339 family protein n=1 Tax=unclassified Luteimonas TaxID=2629088 RepID=UPI0006879EE0|nr:MULTISPECIES: DUF6339 family protein [unclassified Luteimonas]TWG89479.1 hypothetical protein L599_004200000070 [Luteimonas sp. J16]